MRGEVPGVEVVNITAPQLSKQQQTFLSQVKNKTSLIRFLVEEWQTEQYVERVQRNRKELYVTCGEKCWRISGDRTVEVPELCSYHEEAVTRLLVLARSVMTQCWPAQKIPMCLCFFWSFPVPLMPDFSRNAELRHAQGWLTLVNWLLLSGKMFVRLSLVFIPSPDVTQLVLLLVKANSSP